MSNWVSKLRGSGSPAMHTPSCSAHACHPMPTHMPHPCMPACLQLCLWPCPLHTHTDLESTPACPSTHSTTLSRMGFLTQLKGKKVEIGEEKMSQMIVKEKLS